MSNCPDCGGERWPHAIIFVDGAVPGLLCIRCMTEEVVGGPEDTHMHTSLDLDNEDVLDAQVVKDILKRCAP